MRLGGTSIRVCSLLSPCFYHFGLGQPMILETLAFQLAQRHDLPHAPKTLNSRFETHMNQPQTETLKPAPETLKPKPLTPRTLLVPLIGDIWSLIVGTWALIEGRRRV